MDIDEWFIDAHNLPQPLSNDETYKLIQLAANGSKEAREKLITHNIRLVLYEVSNKFLNVEYDKKDLVSIGNIGLLKAINTYDVSKGFEFATYAVRCIDNEILMFLRKLKKHQNTDSIDRVVFSGKDGSEIKLEDKLSDGSDLVQDHEQNETYSIIRKLVNGLKDRDKEIIKMHFGFYDDRIYTQKEIADKFNISRSYVANIIRKIVKKLGKQLEDVVVIELHEEPKTKEKEKDKKEMRRLQSIYEYFNNYTREQVDEMLSRLSKEDRALVTLRYGEDLDNPVRKKLTEKDESRFYRALVPKMKRLLAKLTGQKEVISKNVSSEIEGELAQQKTLSQQNLEATSNQEIKDITKDDCIKMLDLLRTPTLTQMMTVLTVKESIIISLKLGYVDGKYFSNESIAKFLGIEEIEVIETTKKVLLLYKENINGFIDTLIDVTTDKNKDRTLSFNK